MSRTNLAAYFESNRPGKRDISIILISILRALKAKKIIQLTMENVFYDMSVNKVYLTEDKFRKGITEKELCVFVKMLCEECRYAGDGVYEFVEVIYKLICEKKYDECAKELERYAVTPAEVKCGMYLICVLFIGICELIYLMISKI